MKLLPLRNSKLLPAWLVSNSIFYFKAQGRSKKLNRQLLYLLQSVVPEVASVVAAMAPILNRRPHIRLPLLAAERLVVSTIAAFAAVSAFGIYSM